MANQNVHSLALLGVRESCCKALTCHSVNSAGVANVFVRVKIRGHLQESGGRVWATLDASQVVKVGRVASSQILRVEIGTTAINPETQVPPIDELDKCLSLSGGRLEHTNGITQCNFKVISSEIGGDKIWIDILQHLDASNERHNLGHPHGHGKLL